MGRTLGALVVAFALGVGARASAQAPASMTVRLSWARGTEAGECATGDAIADDVRRRLGRDPFSATPTHTIDGFVDRAAGRWHAQLVVRDETGAVVGDRQLESAAATCASLDAAVALALALVIDPEARLSMPPATPPPPHVVAPPPRPRIAPAPTAPRAPADTHPRGSAFAALSGGLGLLPGVTFGATLGVDVAIVGLWHAGAELVFHPETRTDSGGNGFAFGLTAGGIGTSAVLGDDVWSLSLGGSLLVGAVHAVVLSLAPVEPGDRVWVAVRAGARLTVRLTGGLALFAGLSAVVPLVDYAFRVEGRTDAVWKMDPVVPVAELGLAWIFS